MRSLFSCSDSRAIPNSPSQLKWKTGLPWANRRGSLNFPLQLKNPATTREKPRLSLFIARCGHCRYSVSKEVLRSILKCDSDTVFGTFDATPKVPQHTGLTGGEHRGSRHHLICAPSPLLIETGGSIPMLFLQGFPTFPVNLRMRPVS